MIFSFCYSAIKHSLLIQLNNKHSSESKLMDAILSCKSYTFINIHRALHKKHYIVNPQISCLTDILIHSKINMTNFVGMTEVCSFTHFLLSMWWTNVWNVANCGAEFSPYFLSAFTYPIYSRQGKLLCWRSPPYLTQSTPSILMRHAVV